MFSDVSVRVFQMLWASITFHYKINTSQLSPVVCMCIGYAYWLMNINLSYNQKTTYRANIWSRSIHNIHDLVKIQNVWSLYQMTSLSSQMTIHCPFLSSLLYVSNGWSNYQFHLFSWIQPLFINQAVLHIPHLSHTLEILNHWAAL